MLSQNDFVSMIGDMETHVEKTILITDELVSVLDDKDLRFKLIALRQSKHLHLEAMSALGTLVRQHIAQAAKRKADAG